MNEIYNEEDIITNWFRSRMDKKKRMDNYFNNRGYFYIAKNIQFILSFHIAKNIIKYLFNNRITIHMIISTVAEKTYEKIHLPVMLKLLFTSFIIHPPNF